MSNQPDRFALFILGPDEKRVEITEDTLVANAATITLNKEDHTLGNLLRHAVLAVPGVLFSGYRVPHPLEPRTVLKIQTDGSITPVQALKMGCEKVISHVGAVRASFKAQSQLYDDQQEPARGGLLGTQSSAFGYTHFGDVDQRGEEPSGYVDI